MKRNKRESELLFQELKGNPYKQLNLSFVLIGIIPALAFVYILLNRTFMTNETLSEISPILIYAIVILDLGYIIGYGVVKRVIDKTVDYAARAKEADELKSKFAVSLAHDLKSPLMAIRVNMDILKGGFLGEVTEKQKKAIDICDKVFDRINSMILELIDTYKIEARIDELKMVRLDLRDLIEEQRRELGPIAAVKNIGFTITVHNEPLIVKADREKMVRVINNILTNSIKYTPGGGKIELKAYPAEGFVHMEFFNNGPAIPKDKLGKIFDKFERLDFSAEGHGLGLAIAKDIVELHKGKIWASSGPGNSNCFTVVLKSAK